MSRMLSVLSSSRSVDSLGYVHVNDGGQRARDGMIPVSICMKREGRAGESGPPETGLCKSEGRGPT
jgi:hypothetical protein